MTYNCYDFFARYNEWVAETDPPDDFKFWFLAWLSRLQDDPTAAAAPAEALGPPWFFAKVPNAEDDQHQVVCVFSVVGMAIRCAGISTLPNPAN